ncbi:hypothetical protein GEV33_006524 [Tenebrio molitor]|uniref:Uncharacterized protein n=1 Tax=Tenebrio molitor TaxID=7067 RepID=A0A8J6HL18_TENMO|nr:hypothetical protein GEV33_006524 [Tenebrio molitor]
MAGLLCEFSDRTATSRAQEVEGRRIFELGNLVDVNGAVGRTIGTISTAEHRSEAKKDRTGSGSRFDNDLCFRK